MKKSITKRIVLFAVLVSLFWNGSISSLAVYSDYPLDDGYETITTLKGQQTALDTEQYGSEHAFHNLDIMQCYIPDEYPPCGIDYFYFEGRGYRFTDYGHFISWVKRQNNAGRTANIQFMVAWNTDNASGLENRICLIDPDARDRSDMSFYAPAASGEGRQVMRAFWAWFMESLAEEDAHIDSVILGNEVNMPDYWHYSGGVGAQATVQKYATSFYDMREIVRRYSDKTRCTICMDHSWSHDEGGREICVKDFLSLFQSEMTRLNGGVPVDDWCIALHLYPATLYEPEIWNGDTNPISEDALFVDGRNLSIATNYIKNHYGENHRVMLTEQGFTYYHGEQAQAASLAYSYYAAKYDPMVDCFILNLVAPPDDAVRMDFAIKNRLAGDIFKKIDNPVYQSYIDNTVLPVIGVSSWSEIIPNYGKTIYRKKYVGSDYVGNAGDTVYGGVDYSAVFDYDYYATMNPDVKKAWNKDILAHFVKYGMAEGRVAKADFNVYLYQKNYPDLAALFGNNLKAYYLHYMNGGKAEGRVADRDISAGGATPVVEPQIDYSDVFDAGFYYDNNPDLQSFFSRSDTSALLNHFVAGGMNEGRQGNAEFNVYLYMSNYPDLKAAFGNDLREYYMHYISNGKQEGRVGNVDLNNTSSQPSGGSYNADDYALVFNAEFYADAYSDLKAAFGNDEAQLLNHFVNSGMAEGRRGNDNFYVVIYKANNPDLEAAFGDDLTSYFTHYINAGHAEGRVANPSAYDLVYNMDYYVANNEDLTNAFGGNSTAAFNHFIYAGMDEGRVASADFNVHVYKENNADIEGFYGENLRSYYLHFIYGGATEGRICK